MLRVVAACLLSVALAGAQEDHSKHARPVTGLGAANFPTTCSPAAQKHFGRAIALLHSFGYEESRRAFRDAAKTDPACAIAHWGEAMTWYHPIWIPPSPEEIGRAHV